MQEILFPVLTGLSLVFAGILVGYFIWFRDQTDQVALCEQLSKDNDRMNEDLEQSRSQTDELELQLEQGRQRNEHLQQLCDDLMASREKSTQHVSELESELYESRCRIDQTREQLTAECRLRSKSEDHLHQARQQYLESVAGIEKEWREKIAESQSLAAHRENELTRLSNSNEQKAQLLHQANAEVAELKSELNAQRQMLEMAKNNAAGLEKEHVSLESTMRSQIELLNESRGQAAAALSAQKLAEESLNETRKQVDELQCDLKGMERLSVDFELLKSNCSTLEQSLENESSRSRTLTEQRDTAVAHADRVRSTLQALRKRSENQEATINQLRLQHKSADEARFKAIEQAKEQLSRECSVLTQRTADAEKSRKKIEDNLRKVLEENAGLSADKDRLERKLVASSEEARSRLQSLIQQRDEALDQNKVLNEELGRMKTHAKANEATIRNLRRERGVVLMRNRQSQDTFPRIHNAAPEKLSDADMLAREYGGKATTDPVRGVVFVERPRISDDLKRIYGVAAVLEQKLNEFGIYTFKQIMEWDDRAVQKFSDLLIFKDRITRDDWMGQAARLYHEDRRSRVA